MTHSGAAPRGTAAPAREARLNTRKHTRNAWIPAAWLLGLLAAAAVAALACRLAAAEVASLALASDFDGNDNVFFGLLSGQGAVAATLLAHGRRAAVRRRRQLLAIGLGLLAIASLLWGALGLLVMLLTQGALIVSNMPHGRP